MTSKFNNLPQEKRNNILKSAIKEFSEKGFDNASTDIIAEGAGIAKGSLFHYFGSKKNLYIFIVEYYVDELTRKILEEVEGVNSNDFYERIKEISLIKQRIIMEYQLESKVIMDAFINMPSKIREEIESLYVKYHTESMKFIEEYLLRYMDTDGLRSFVTKEDVVFVTMTLIDALSKKYMAVYKDSQNDLIEHNEKLLRDFDKYIDIIKHGLYK